MHSHPIRAAVFDIDGTLAMLDKDTGTYAALPGAVAALRAMAISNLGSSPITTISCAGTPSMAEISSIPIVSGLPNTLALTPVALCNAAATAPEIPKSRPLAPAKCGAIEVA